MHYQDDDKSAKTTFEFTDTPCMEGDPVHVTILLISQFAMMAFSGAVEPLRVANRMSGRRLFTWEILSVDGGPVTASNGIQVVADRSIQDVERTEVLIVCSSFQPELYETNPLLHWLKRQARSGARIGALDTGSHILAKAGLLEGHEVTLHWEAISAFQEEFPHIKVSRKIFISDRDRFSCAGGMSSLDMQLHFISQYAGRDVAEKAAEQFIYEHSRKSELQRLDNAFKFGMHNSKLLTVLDIMESNLEQPIECGKLSRLVNISRRQLERLFRTHLQSSPAEYYLRLRLNRGRQLLQQSSLSVLDIALACGFGSPSAFARAYRTAFGHPPSRDRNILTPVMAGRKSALEQDL